MTLLKDDNNWVIVNSNQLLEFTSIEDACSFLEQNGVKDEEIDIALSEMIVNNTNKAHFNLDGVFSYTDNMGGES
jgi:hypothetical protein